MQTSLTINGYQALKYFDKWFIFQDGKCYQFERFMEFVAWASGQPKAAPLTYLRPSN